MRKLVGFLSLALSLIGSNASAQTATELQEIESYLNSIKTMEAKFVQSASNGNSSEGKLFITKPNKIRMEYGAPTNVLIVGDGEFIIYNDIELDQVTHIDYDDIPASLILANDVKIDGKKFKVKDFYKDAGITSITLEYAQNSDVGPITLIFNNNPFELRQWTIVDPQSVEITVSLYDTQKDMFLADDLFKFKKESASPMNYKKGKRK